MKIVNQKFISLLVALIVYTATATAQGLITPRAVSPASELKQTIGLSEVSIKYSRPRVTLRGNDRTDKIWGQQVAYGFNKINFGSQNEIPWRAGANENTIITFSDDVKIEGKDLKAGTYGLHMAIYDGNKATVIFSKNYSSWGSFYYYENEDALRVDVKMEDISKTEVLTYDFIEMGANYGVLALSWEKKRIPFKIEIANMHEVVLQSYKDQLRSAAGFGWRGYVTAASYCIQNNTHLDQALTWIDKSINNTKNFNNLATKARILTMLGKENDGYKMLDEAATIANLNQLNNLGYQLLGQQKLEKAIEYFSLNVKRNPKNANVYDSLGEAYKIKGDNKNAIKSFKKSLSLNPAQNVKDNSIKLLKELGVDYKG